MPAGFVYDILIVIWLIFHSVDQSKHEPINTNTRSILSDSIAKTAFRKTGDFLYKKAKIF